MWFCRSAQITHTKGVALVFPCLFIPQLFRAGYNENMLQRDIPRELLIGENVWTIRFVRSVDGNSNTLGHCDPSNYEILIKQGQSYESRADSLIHECLHALGYEFGFYEMKHGLVYKISEAVTKLFMDNFL